MKYVEGQRAHEGLHRWNVVIAGIAPRERGPLGDLDLGLPERVGLIRRSRMNIELPHANIKSLMSRVDRVADMPELDKRAAGLSDRQLQHERPKRVGLLVIYPIQAESKPRVAAAPGKRPRVALGAAADVIGVGLVFPDSEGGSLGEVEYVAAFAEADIEDADELAIEAAAELDRIDEEEDTNGDAHGSS